MGVDVGVEQVPPECHATSGKTNLLTFFCTIINNTPTYAVPSSASRPRRFNFSRHPSFSPLLIYRAACAVHRPFLRRFSKASGLGEVPVPRLPPARACRRPAGCAAKAAAAAAAAAGPRVALQSLIGAQKGPTRTLRQAAASAWWASAPLTAPRER